MKRKLSALVCTAMTLSMMCLPAVAEEPVLIASGPQGDFAVVVNGTDVVFSDAVPQLKNDRSCLPFVAVFEQLGFSEQDMTWDGDTKTVTATKGDVTISLTVGTEEIVVVEHGVTQNIRTDVAPYIDATTSRTYIPLGLVADAMGYRVGWDAENRVVLIDDIPAILEENTETYQLVNQYLEYAREVAKDTYSMTGAYTCNFVTTNTEAENEQLVGMGLNGDYVLSVQGNNAFQFVGDLAVAVSVEEQGEDVTQTIEETYDVAFPMNLDMELRGRIEDGTFYLKSRELTERMGGAGEEEVWYQLELANLTNDTLGMDYSEWMRFVQAAQDMEFEDCLEVFLQTAPLSSSSDTSADRLMKLNRLFGDSQFIQDGDRYFSQTTEGDISIQFTLSMESGRVNGYQMVMSELQKDEEVAMVVDMLGHEMSVELVWNKMGVSLEMELHGTYEALNTAPVTEPHVDALVVDMTHELLKF